VVRAASATATVGADAEESRSVLQELYGVEALVAGLADGSGLRLIEDPAACGADLDFQRHS